MPPGTPSGYAFQKQGSELPLPLTGTETLLKDRVGVYLLIKSELPLPLTGTETSSLSH